MGERKKSQVKLQKRELASEGDGVLATPFQRGACKDEWGVGGKPCNIINTRGEGECTRGERE